MTSRRHFIALLPVSLLAGVTSVRRGYAARGPLDHPTPRPGITAAKVLTREQIGSDHADVAPVFDMVRQIPEVADGIRCQCGCAKLEGKYSLLSCYEADGMARHCEICQNEGRLAFRLHKQGKTLDEIRSAIDAKFG